MFKSRSLLAALVRLRGFILASAFLGAALGASSSHALGIQAWRELKYGMFIHYGMSTFDGEELSDGKTPVSSFKPTAQDVDQWVRVAKSAGMKYAVLTAKHVAGFCLWDSKVTWKGAEFAYDVGASPVKTDIVAEFMKACAKYGIVPGIYYCSMDRRHSYPEIEWTPTLPFISEEYFKLMQDHLTELHTSYPGIAIQWIDIPRHLTAAQRTTLYDRVRSLNPACMIEFNYGTESRDIPGDYTMEVAAKVTLPTDILNSEITAIKRPFQIRQTYTWGRLTNWATSTAFPWPADGSGKREPRQSLWPACPGSTLVSGP
jgi:alpha-L-fucosidase